MTVKVIHSTPLEVADQAISKCWDKTTDKPKERMYRVANKFKHSSTIEHVTISFDIDGISRACLQELARHRMQSLSVKSTRYTLKELKDAVDVSNFLVPTGVEIIDRENYTQLKRVQKVLQIGLSNDKVKYMLPEAYKTSLVSTMNLRALQNFLSLRTDKSALWEIRELAYAMYEAVPEEYKFMLEDFVKGEDKDDRD